MKNKVIIFEDNLIASLALEAMLKNNGFESVGKFDSADNVMELYSENKPDIVLMDIMLNGETSGLEAAEKLRTLSDVPILFLTALNDSDTTQRVDSLQNTGLYIKPYLEEIIARKIKELL